MTQIDDGAGRGEVLRFSAIIECPECQVEFDGHWTDNSIDVEQIAEPPMADQQCPSCGVVTAQEYPGWTNFSDAG